MNNKKPKTLNIDGIEVISSIQLKSRKEIDSKMAKEFSLMKYGDPKATFTIAQKMVDLIKSDKIMSEELKKKDLVLTSSSYGYVPTGSYAVVRQMANILRSEGVKVDIMKIDRSGVMGETHYCAMSIAERAKFMAQRTTWVSKENKAMVKGRFILAIDDLCATGNHIKDINNLISTTKSRGRRFATYISFTPNLAKKDAATEGFISRFHVKTLKEMNSYFNKPSDNNLELVLNTRTLKFILQTSKTEEGDLPEAKKEKLLKKFIETRDNYTLNILQEAINSSDGYPEFEKFHKGIALVTDEYNSRNMLGLKINQLTKYLSKGYQKLFHLIRLGRRSPVLDNSYPTA